MKKAKRVKQTALLLALALTVSSVLSGCGLVRGIKVKISNFFDHSKEQTTSESDTARDDDPVPTPAPAPKEDDNSGKTDEGEKAQDTGYTLDFDVKTEADYIPMLTGKWSYFGPNGSEDLCLEFEIKEDGTYLVTRFGPAPMSVIRGYEGKWKTDRFIAGSDELPDFISFEVTESYDESFDMNSLGDFQVGNWAIMNNAYVMGLRQYNNGDSLFSWFYDDPNPVLFKDCTENPVKAPEFEVSRGATFDADLWHVEYSGDDAILYLTDYSKSDSSNIGVTTKYTCKTDLNSTIPVEALERGFHKLSVTTDDLGNVVDMTYRADDLDKAIYEEYNMDGSPYEMILPLYVAKKYDFSISNGLTMTSYFDKPIFIGKDEGIKKLNSKIDDIFFGYYTAYIEGGRVDEEFETLSDMGYFDDFLYAPYDIRSIYVDDNGNASVAFSWEWYMGGVYNLGYETVNMNVKTGDPVGIEDVLNVSRDEADSMIADALKKQCDLTDEIKPILKNIESYKFWFNEDTVYVGFDSYELEQGTGFFEVTIDR